MATGESKAASVGRFAQHANILLLLRVQLMNGAYDFQQACKRKEAHFEHKLCDCEQFFKVQSIRFPIV